MAVLISVDNLNMSATYINSNRTEAILMPGVTISHNLNVVIKLIGFNDGFVSDGTILALSNGAGLQMTGAKDYMIFGASSIYRSDATVG